MQFDDFLIRKAAFGVSCIGIVLLFLIGSFTEEKFMPIHEISNENIGSKVSTYGLIIWSHESENALLFMISDFGKINCVIFRPSSEQALLAEKGHEVIVHGKVIEYKGVLEINVEKIEVVG